MFAKRTNMTENLPLPKQTPTAPGNGGTFP